MKKALLCFALLMAGVMNAQIVNIPDASFKHILLSYNYVTTDLAGNDIDIDSNNDNEIQVSEALNISEINIGYFYGNSIIVNSLVGIEAFTNLKKLNFSYNNNNVSEIDLSNLTLLEELNCAGNDLTSLDLSALTNLKTLNCVNNDLEAIILDGLVNLETLNCAINPFGTLDLSDLVNLKYLTCSTCNLTTLDLSNQMLLKQLKCQSNAFTSLDLSTCPNLEYVKAASCPQIQYINLKNGGILSSVPLCDFTNNPSLTHICADDTEDVALLNYYINAGLPPVQISTYCTFIPGGNYNTISGTVSFDNENNGCDTTDTPLLYTFVQINDGTTTAASSSANGTYNFYTQAGTFTLTPQFENDYFIADVATLTFADNNNNSVTQNFCVTSNGIHPDVEVVVTPLTLAQPGFDTQYKIMYKNKGNQTLSGTVAFMYDDAVLDYVSAVPAETTATTGSLSWNYTNLLPFETKQITLTLNVNSPMETPAVNIDDVLMLSVSITPTAGDETPDDNTLVLNQTVVGSFDPNDITCLEGATVNPANIGGYLHYNINFENTGTAPATFVVVKDIIDATKFDVNSLVVLNASHALETKVTGNKVEFIFDNINLAANGGKGNVTFKIKSLETLAVNSSVMQKADIFFDYNWPIVTNEFVTTYALLNTPGFIKDASVKVYPNPANNVVSITAESAIQSVQLFDVQGRLLEALNVNDINATLDVTQRAIGIYFIKVATKKGVNVEKLIKE